MTDLDLDAIEAAATEDKLTVGCVMLNCDIFDELLLIARTYAKRVADAEAAEKAKYLDATQELIDSVCLYRNLAIVLGAKPEQMQGSHDRKLCEMGIDPNDDGGGEYLSITGELDDLKQTWGELEACEIKLEAAVGLLREARDWIHKVGPSFMGEVDPDSLVGRIDKALAPRP